MFLWSFKIWTFYCQFWSSTISILLIILEILSKLRKFWENGDVCKVWLSRSLSPHLMLLFRNLVCLSQSRRSYTRGWIMTCETMHYPPVAAGSWFSHAIAFTYLLSRIHFDRGVIQSPLILQHPQPGEKYFYESGWYDIVIFHLRMRIDFGNLPMQWVAKCVV